MPIKPILLRNRAVIASALAVLVYAQGPVSSAQSPEEEEEDGVFVRKAERGAGASVVAQDLPHSRRCSGSWFLSIGVGTGFPQYDDGNMVNGQTGAITPVGANVSFAFTALVSTGYRWFDPERWGHWSFDLDFVGAYLGTGQPVGGAADAINLGFLGLRGRIGYRVLNDRLEPFVGFASGGVLVNTETSGVDHGAVWGYWFAPVGGFRYYIPRSRWSVSIEGLFRFLGGIDGLSGPGLAINETPHAGWSGSWIYVPLGVVAIGYRF